MRAAANDESRSPPLLALPARADRFQLWKLQRDRERREQRLGMAASPLPPRPAGRRAANNSAEERRIARRVASHSEEEDELMHMIAERERQGRESDSGKRLRRLQQQEQQQEQQQQQQRRRQLPPLPTSALARSRRFTVPMQTAEQPREDEPVPRRPFGSASRIPPSAPLDAASMVGETTGTIPLRDIADRYAFQPASSLRWRSMKPPVAGEKGNAEQRKQQEEADADRILEQAAMDSGKRKDLWDNFYVGTKASCAAAAPQVPVSPAVYSASDFRDERELLQSPSSVGSWGHLAAPLNDGGRPRGKAEASEQHSSTQSSDVFGQSSLDHQLHGLRHRLRLGSDSGASVASEAGRALHEELPGLTMRPRGQTESDDVGAAPVIPEAGRLGPKRAFDDIFPPWSVVFLASCVAAGVGGFFIEEAMEVAGVFFTAMPFSVSRAEQRRLHERLEGLQKELRGFRSAASEIDAHSQKVFDEVRRHLDKLRAEREKHQDMVAREMHGLRRYVLQMTYEMVEQERRAIHQRLEETVGSPVAGEAASLTGSQASKSVDHKSSSVVSKASAEAAAVHRPADATPDTTTSDATGSVESTQVKASTTLDSHHAAAATSRAREGDAQPDDKSRDVAVILAAIDDVVNSIELVGELPTPASTPAVTAERATRAPAQGALFMSWQATLVLVVLVFVGSYVGLRLRSMNRRRKWLENRRRRRQQQQQQQFFSPSRRSQHVDDSEQDEDDEWEQAGSDYSVETVALMTPVNSGGEDDDDADYEPEEQADLTSSVGSEGRSEYESELDGHHDEAESNGEEEETKGEEHYFSDEWDEMEREEEDAEDYPLQFVHPSTEHEHKAEGEEEPARASDSTAVYRMATAERRFPFVVRAGVQAKDTARESARMERRKFARRYL